MSLFPSATVLLNCTEVVKGSLAARNTLFPPVTEISRAIQTVNHAYSVMQLIQDAFFMNTTIYCWNHWMCSYKRIKEQWNNCFTLAWQQVCQKIIRIPVKNGYFLALKRRNQVYKGPTILYKTQMTLISHLRLTWKTELLHEVLLDRWSRDISVSVVIKLAYQSWSKGYDISSQSNTKSIN